MKIFVTGATGYIGSEVVKELISNGHQVIGLTRNELGEKKLKELGAEAHLGTLEDLENLKIGVEKSDGVIHLAFNHDFSDFMGSLQLDVNVIKAIGEVLVGTNKPFLTTAHANGIESEKATLELATKGVRASIVSLAPSVHGDGDKGFVPQLIEFAREKCVSSFVGEGLNRWTAIHKSDAAKLYRLAIEKAPAGSILDGVADESIEFIEIAKAIGDGLNLPVASITADEAMAQFGFLGQVVQIDVPRSSATTRKLLDWQPEYPNLIEDLKNGNYFQK